MRDEFSVLITDQCHSCGVCMDVCPTGSLDMTPPHRASIEGGGDAKPTLMEFPMLTGACSGCRICEIECPFGAISVVARDAAPVEHVERADVDIMVARRSAFTRARAARSGGPASDFRPLSSLTRDALKKPVRSPFPREAGWKPNVKGAGPWRVWRRGLSR